MIVKQQGRLKNPGFDNKTSHTYRVTYITNPTYNIIAYSKFLMGETRGIRIIDHELENWIDENIPKGELNSIVNDLLLEYQRKQKQEYKEQMIQHEIDQKSLLFQGVVYLSIAVWMLVFALSMFFDVLAVIATILLIFNGILLCIYAFKNNIKKKGMVMD